MSVLNEVERKQYSGNIFQSKLYELKKNYLENIVLDIFFLANI